MRALRSQLAIVLLLCFARVLVPDAWILALHEHQHTGDVALEVGHNIRQADVVSSQHQHCAVNYFFNAAFQPPAPLVLPVPPVAYQLARSVPGASLWYSATRITANLRGPPTA
ncbi:hypothetical protein D0N36_04420 [Hymenobacter lapidiphilus]|uniref:hypothetical protein n=1 Tax=Hymenobacter sp. CCM 8763 TaxID=2303334 RepID=UPI000E35417B|nr:hypothetical protein [Hymenobacter sp. CCM 8763]RFP66269.1 hypothetical protein D0N36_04420 [Hymenobacter sp. CCM 8763]